MPSRASEPKTGDICIFGDSHLGAVKRAHDGGLIDTGGRALRFWGADGPSFRKLRWRNGRIRPDADIRDLVLEISGGLDSLGPKDFHTFIFYGARLRAHDFFKAVLDHESRPQGHISQAQMQALVTRWSESVRAWRLACAFADAGAEVVFVPTAFPSEGVVDKALEQENLAVRSTKAARTRLWALLVQAAEAKGFQLLVQPEDTITSNTLTKRDFSTPNAKETRDWVHKSPEFAARMVAAAIGMTSQDETEISRVVAAQ